MADTSEEPLLAEKVYEDAEANLSGSEHSDYDQELTARPTDRRILDEPDQHESLLTKPDRFDGVRKAFSRRQMETSARRTKKRGRQMREQAEGSGSVELIYEMEGGHKDTSSRSSSESLVYEKQKRHAAPTKRSNARIIFIALGILILFFVLLFGSYKASRKSPVIAKLSNGTHLFAPTTILISLDGFRADFLQRDLTPSMKAFVESGVSPKYMLASFPTLTFPNHFTLVTGLYPESHGIVSNQFWDPHFEEEFWYTNTNISMQPKWWNAEPIWVTAETQGLKTAIHMWPGSEAHISNMDPTYLDKFNGSEALDVKVNRILQWLDMPEPERPQLIGAYVPDVDSDGHGFGPNSTEIRGTIVEVDQMLTYLVEGLYERNLTEVVNLVIVSDHGMATTSNERLVQLDDLIDLSLVDHIDGWPLRGLRLKNPEQDLPGMHQKLLEASRDAAFDVYSLETMPQRYHFTNNDRIAPLWIIPEPGWVVIEKAEFDIEAARITGEQYVPMGLHGYDHEHPLMRAIFVARGPAFPHQPNSRLAPFQNIEVYNIVCDSLGIEPHPNNGTLRLPLKTEGLHSDFVDEEVPVDPVESEIPSATEEPVVSTPTTEESVASTTATLDVPPVATGMTDSNTNGSEQTHTKSSWWDYIHNQIQKAKDWAKQMVDSIKNNKPGNDENGPT